MSTIAMSVAGMQSRVEHGVSPVCCILNLDIKGTVGVPYRSATLFSVAFPTFDGLPPERISQIDLDVSASGGPISSRSMTFEPRFALLSSRCGCPTPVLARRTRCASGGRSGGERCLPCGKFCIDHVNPRIMSLLELIRFSLPM